MDWETRRYSSSCACCFLYEYLPRGTEETTSNLSRNSRYHNRQRNWKLPNSSNERRRSGQLGRCLHCRMILM